MDISGNLNITEIDSKLETWYEIVEEAINKIPTKQHIIEQKLIISAHLRYIQNQNTFRYYKQLQIALKQESEEIRDKNRKNVISKTAGKYKDPKAFWKEIKSLRGGKAILNPHLEVNNKKLHQLKKRKKLLGQSGRKYLKSLMKRMQTTTIIKKSR